MCYIFMYFYSDLFSCPKSLNNSGILVSKKSEILTLVNRKYEDESDFEYLLLNFKSMRFGMFFNQMNRRKTYFLYMSSYIYGYVSLLA